LKPALDKAGLLQTGRNKEFSWRHFGTDSACEIGILFFAPFADALHDTAHALALALERSTRPFPGLLTLAKVSY
jgi:hypothetical protein